MRVRGPIRVDCPASATGSARPARVSNRISIACALHRDDFPWRADSLQLAAGQHGHAIAQHFGVGKNVRREKNGAPLFLQLQDDVAHFTPSHGVEAGHRLVENHHLRIVQDRLRDSHALQHPFRKFSQLHVARRSQTHALEIFPHALAAFARAVVRKSRVIIEQFARRQVVVEVRLLGQIADLAVHLDVVDRPAANARRAAGRENQPHQQLHRGRFPRAIRPEEAENFSVFHLQTTNCRATGAFSGAKIPRDNLS